jgi:acetyl-CoA carboxylase carboxyl transferase subunit alpha
MYTDRLNFELPIVELEQKIAALKNSQADEDVAQAIEKLTKSLEKIKQKTFSNLNATAIVQLARHPLRPHASDYINKIFTDFQELHGDRQFSAGNSIIAGLANLDGKSCVVIGQEKGRTTKERLHRNFGMPSPEGYRKALRIMKLAEKFRLPIFTFIDTPGAYPGVGAEERNQSEAIARNLYEFAKCKSPIITTIIGEGGSGGALAIGVSDVTLMCQYSIYSVISPEGCASILWKDNKRSNEAAEALGLTAEKLLQYKLIDDIIPEPLGGAHYDVDQMADNIKQALLKNIKNLNNLQHEQLLKKRYDRLMLSQLNMSN